jgi:TrpR family transcriptional regulator, trp operon repressor
MTSFSKETGWRNFLKLCLAADSIEMLESIMNLYLTPEERDDLAARALIVNELLRQEQTQREMAENLEVSIAKITRGSNMLKTIDPNFKEYLIQRIKDD